MREQGRSFAEEPTPEIPNMPDYVRQYKALHARLSPTLSYAELTERLAIEHSFSRAIKAKYPDAEVYQLYDWFVGGSGGAHVTKQGDFDGNLSVERFMRRFIEQNGALERVDSTEVAA